MLALGYCKVNGLISLAFVAILSVVGCSNSPFTQIRDPVSAGSAKLLLVVGETTQREVLEAFGGPNITTGDAAGQETWTYDRMSYESGSSAVGGAVGGGGPIGGGGGGGLLWGHASRASTSSRTVTLFLYWQDGQLVDYKYRSATF
jgi:hypothetical protein